MNTPSLQYVQLTPSDHDIPILLDIHRLPEIARFIHIDPDHYFDYVTSSDGVFYFKVYLDEQLAGTVHLESAGKTLYLSLLVLPKYQNRGIGSRILEDLKSGVLIREFSEIQVAIERDNLPSLHLFEKAGFVLTGKDDGLLEYTLTDADRAAYLKKCLRFTEGRCAHAVLPPVLPQ